jgi:hypothetical protein
MDYKMDENRLVFTKIDKIGPDWFLRFIKNQTVKILKNILKKLKKRKLEKLSDKLENLSDKLEKLNDKNRFSFNF